MKGGRIVVIAGTRPECIKLVPLLTALAGCRYFETLLVNSGQHRDAVTHMLAAFGLRCQVTAAPLPPSPNLGTSSQRLRAGLRAIVRQAQPTLVVVQGDTLTAYAGARAGHDLAIPVVHVEAGLRSPSASDPFPEEWFRRRIARHAALHFAPSASAHANLLAEGIEPRSIHCVGNTGIDALRALLQANPGIAPPAGATPKRVLVTLHRRENWDGKADVICDALVTIARRRPALDMLIPLHPNPRIAPRIRARLHGIPGFRLVDPMDYRDFIASAAGAALIISDSGGIQEEAPHLGVPLLVPRSCTERPEGVATGFVRLVRTDHDDIVAEALAMLAAPRRRPLPFDRDAPFGAGDAAARIVEVLERSFVNAVAA
jgi:UDP-N-acetylglucosamine 2-epimerase (non-hydrolysing)